MSRGLADTSYFVAREAGRPTDENRIPGELAISAITIGELHAGVLAADEAPVRAQRLSTLIAAQEFSALPVDADVAEAWARLRIALRDSGQRMDVNDSWIAATAIAHGVPVVTQDVGFVPLLGLEIIEV